MKKRDLKADLKELTSLKENDVHFMSIVCFIENNAEKWLEQGISESERAEKLEALAWELAKKMELMRMAVNALLLGEDVPVEVVDRITLGVSSVLLKAKEVLGDG